MTDISDITSCTKSLLREKKKGERTTRANTGVVRFFFSPEVVTRQFLKWIHLQVPNEVRVSNMA